MCEPITSTQHRLILCGISAAISPNFVPFRRKFNFRKADWTAFSNELDKRISCLPPTSDNYDQFVEIVTTVSRKTIPRGCRTQHIPGLSAEAVEQIDRYIGEYNIDPFNTHTIEEGTKSLNAVAETRRKIWCETLQSVDMRHDSRKSWELIRRLGNIPRRPTIQPRVTLKQIAHTLFLNGKPPKINRKIKKNKILREVYKETHYLFKQFESHEL